MTEFRFEELVALCRNTLEQAKMWAARSADTSMVVRNWLLGRHIFEFEQHGSDRAGYGDNLILCLSEALANSIDKGFSSRNLELVRKFYTMYREISQTLSAKSEHRLLLRRRAGNCSTGLWRLKPHRRKKDLPLIGLFYWAELAIHGPMEPAI